MAFYVLMKSGNLITLRYDQYGKPGIVVGFSLIVLIGKVEIYKLLIFAYHISVIQIITK